VGLCVPRPSQENKLMILSYIRLPVLEQSKNFLGDWGGGRGPRGPPLNTPMSWPLRG